MVDRTVYPTDTAPDTGLRQIFARQRLPENLCLLIASAGIKSIEQMAMLGDTLQVTKDTVKILITDLSLLGATPAAQTLALTSIAAVWKASSVLQDHFATRRARMEEDPHKIPEIPQDDHSEFRAKFIESHPDMILNVWREPHKKLVERIHRDFLVHGSIPFYQVGELRIRGEIIAQKSGLAKSAEDLIKASLQDEPTHVASEEEVINRLWALFIALEYLNICSFSVKSGPVQYLRELEEFRHDHPGLNGLIRLDKLLRKKACQLSQDQRDLYPNFSEALLEVLKNRRYLFNDARAGEKRARSVSPEKTNGKKRNGQDNDRDELNPGGKKVSKSKLKRQRQKVNGSDLRDCTALCAEQFHGIESLFDPFCPSF
jgi:hypothetical protein